MASQSDESGKQKFYISPFPKPEGRQQSSVPGGTLPHWRGDGKELFYLAPDGKLMSMELQEINGLLQSTSSRSLFQTHATAATLDNYDVTPDGKGFLANIVGTDETAEPLDLVVNWTSELKK